MRRLKRLLLVPKFIGVFFGARTLKTIRQVVECGFKAGTESAGHGLFFVAACL